MRDELLNEIFTIIDKTLCPQIGIPLVDGRVELALRPRVLQVLNKLLNEGKDLEDFPLDPSSGRYDDVIFTETERLKLTQFFKTIGKLPVLCVQQRSVHSYDKFIDLRGFKKLQALKVVRINLKYLKWISTLKSQLSSLKCVHSVETSSILCDTLAWAELVNLSVNFCDIQPVDNSHYFRNSPWIRKLDVSHSKLKQCGFLVHLEHLEHLNLSYNFICHIPKLNERCSLSTLIMNFNNVADLSGLKEIPTLTEVDLSDNWVPDKYSLYPLKYLKSLESIKLKGSPVSLIKFYRVYVAASMSSDTTNSKISIDGVFLSRTEQSCLGLKLFEPKGPSSSAVATVSANLDLPSTSRGFVDATPSSSVITGSEYNRSLTPGKPRKTVRVPVIWDESQDQDELNQPSSSNIDEITKSVPMAPMVFPTKPMPTVEQNLNEELMAIREAIIRSQPVAGSVRSLEENRMISTLLNPESLSLHLGGITLPSPMPLNDDSPTTEILPATVLAQVHATEVDVHPDINNLDLVETCEPRTDRVTDDSAKLTSLSQPEEGDQLENPEVNCDTLETGPTTTKLFQLEDKAITKLHEDNGTDSGVCSDNRELISSTECEDETSGATLQRVEEQVELTNPTLLDEDKGADAGTENTITGPNDYSQNSTEDALEDEPPPKDSDEESCYESDADDDYMLWQVSRIEPSTKNRQPILLALLESELKERSTKSRETLTKWPLDTVLSCVKTKNDPITIEMEFDSEKKDRQHRAYVMEYADAKTLTKKIYTILESRPLSAMNQVSLKCLKCASMFVHSKLDDNKTKATTPSCPNCGNSSVTEAEEPKLPENVPAPKPLSHAASHSSIAVGRGAETPGSDASSTAIDSCSAASIEQSQKSGSHHYRKYESDIEVISNPSQSSIEVIDESSRSQSVTPRRKRSEELQPTTYSESNSREAAPLSALTESSSSGSLTESVITAYESHSVIINKKSMSAVSLPEEGGEESPDNSVYIAPKGTLEEDNGNLAIPKSSQDVYSFTDFVDVDLRVKTFIYHNVFMNENEELRALIRCHVWKTGGSDYDGCFVLSTSAAYFLFHLRTDFSEQICDWLSLNESFSLSDMKKVQPIIWYQGLEIQIKNFSFLLLVMDQERTRNLVTHLSGLSLKGVKIVTKPNSKIELSLQQAVLTSNLSHTLDDPTVMYMVICRSVEISKGDSEEILRLAGLVITAGLFLLIPGDLSWLCSAIQPSIVSSRDLPSLIEVAKKGTDLVLRFFNETEATEEKWTIKLGAAGQLGPLLDAIRKPWETKFSVSLEVTGL